MPSLRKTQLNKSGTTDKVKTKTLHYQTQPKLKLVNNNRKHSHKACIVVTVFLQYVKKFDMKLVCATTAGFA